MEGIEAGFGRFLVAAVYDCRTFASLGVRRAQLQGTALPYRLV